MTLNVGTEVVTEYTSDSQYVSSIEGNTPYPSLTLSKKFELEKYLHNGEITYNISTFSEPDVIERIAEQSLRTSSEQEGQDEQEEQQPDSVPKDSENNGCCLLL